MVVGLAVLRRRCVAEATAASEASPGLGDPQAGIWPHSLARRFPREGSALGLMFLFSVVASPSLLSAAAVALSAVSAVAYIVTSKRSGCTCNVNQERWHGFGESVPEPISGN